MAKVTIKRRQTGGDRTIGEYELLRYQDFVGRFTATKTPIFQCPKCSNDMTEIMDVRVSCGVLFFCNSCFIEGFVSFDELQSCQDAMDAGTWQPEVR